jgi:hypothetical protein
MQVTWEIGVRLAMRQVVQSWGKERKRFMPVWHDRRCILVHIPKTAGVTIETLLGNSAASWLGGAMQINGHEICPQHVTAATLRAHLGNQVFDSYFRFAVVRNPYDRMFSEFHWQQQGKRSTIATFDDFVDTVYHNFSTIQRPFPTAA